MKKTLHNIKNTGFNIPEDYFTSLEDIILSNAKLREVAPTSGHKVPDDYFDSIEDNIINLVQQKETKVVKLITWHKIAYVGAVAASIVLMFNIFFNNGKDVSINTIETASIENYILDEDLEINEFASLFTEEELSNIRLINDGYNQQKLENYLFENLEIDDIVIK